MADEDRHAEVEKLARTGHEFEIVGMGLAESDPRIEADPVEWDPRGEERVATLLEVDVDIAHDVVVAGIDLHRLWRALHVHGTDAGTRIEGDAEHVRVALQARDIVDDLGAQFDRPGGHHRLRRVNRDRHAGPLGQLPHHLAHAAKFLIWRHGL
jgi:hypothetical protein